MKILVVDDEATLCLLYSSELEDEGYEVKTALNEKEAMELFHKERFDLVTLDIAMPSIKEKVGLKLLKRMKEIRPSIPIIIISAFNFVEDALKYKADAYITKTSNSTEMKETIKNLCH
jgi:CheY-like chemotaxis protein